MKYIVLFCSLIFNICANAQPTPNYLFGEHSTISIDSIIKNKDILDIDTGFYKYGFKKNKARSVFEKLKVVNKYNFNRSSLSVIVAKNDSIVEEKLHLYYKSDTMVINIKNLEIYKLNITIKKFYFLKGEYTIDLMEYYTKYGQKESFEIDEFPENCMVYTKEEEK